MQDNIGHCKCLRHYLQNLRHCLQMYRSLLNYRSLCLQIYIATSYEGMIYMETIISHSTKLQLQISLL